MTITSLLSIILIFFSNFFQTIFGQVTFPCMNPVTFQIVQIDNKEGAGFNLSTTTAIEYAKDAANLWNKNTGKNLLKYSDDGQIKITFHFDKRQRQVIQDTILQEKIKNQENLLNQKSQTINGQQETFNSLKINYESQVEIYNQRLNSYNANVDNINRAGGATAEQKNSLDAEQKYLQDKGQELDKTRNDLNNYLQNIKANVKKYNAITENVNQVIEKVNQGAGTEFEEGVYQGNKITLYEYENVIDLKRLLAHELGHALGFQHVDDPEAIMYYLNNGNNFVLTKGDIAEYKRVCNVVK